MRFAVGDIHGYREELADAMTAAGLIDAAGDWAGGTQEVWFAGDLLDRGPDGVGVVADVMRWQRQAADVGGFVGSVIGNHEVLALGVRKFGDSVVAGGDPTEIPRSFALSWMVNGGRSSDQAALTDDMVEWMAGLPAIVLLDDDLVMHADTTEYLSWGDDPKTINRSVYRAMAGDDLAQHWDIWRGMTDRYAYLGRDGRSRARSVLDRLGGRRIVHGHSLVSDLREIDATDVEEAWSYADGLALAVDGGIYAGGPCLIVPLTS